MNTNYEEVLRRLTDFLKSESSTETVIGKEFSLGAFTCVPVIRLGMGFGFGGGEGDMPGQTGHGEGSGAGAGFGIEPMGFLVSKGQEISFVPTRSSKGLAAAFEKMPDLLEKFMSNRAAQEPAA